MVQRLKINQFYGAPTAIRLLLKYGDQWVHKYDRSSLKTLGSGMPVYLKIQLCAQWFIIIYFHNLFITLYSALRMQQHHNNSSPQFNHKYPYCISCLPHNPTSCVAHLINVLYNIVMADLTVCKVTCKTTLQDNVLESNQRNSSPISSHTCYILKVY